MSEDLKRRECPVIQTGAGSVDVSEERCAHCREVEAVAREAVAWITAIRRPVEKEKKLLARAAACLMKEE